MAKREPRKSKWYRPLPLKVEPQPCSYRSAGMPGDMVQFHGTVADVQYLEWLAKSRGISHPEALAYCNAMDRRKLISADECSDDSEPNQWGVVPANNRRGWRLRSQWYRAPALRYPAMARYALHHQATAYRASQHGESYRHTATR